MSEAQGFHDASDIAKIRRRLKDTCFYCGVNLSGKGSVDHMTPIA